MTPQDWAHVPWYARQRAQQAARRSRRAESVLDAARRFQAAMRPDPEVAEHLASLDHYTSTPRKRTA